MELHILHTRCWGVLQYGNANRQTSMFDKQAKGPTPDTPPVVREPQLQVVGNELAGGGRPLMLLGQPALQPKLHSPRQLVHVEGKAIHQGHHTCKGRGLCFQEMRHLGCLYVLPLGDDSLWGLGWMYQCDLQQGC